MLDDKKQPKSVCLAEELANWIGYCAFVFAGKNTVMPLLFALRLRLGMGGCSICA